MSKFKFCTSKVRYRFPELFSTPSVTVEAKTEAGARWLLSGWIAWRSGVHLDPGYFSLLDSYHEPLPIILDCDQ